MNNNIFRSKSIDRISAPEQLNDYVRVSNPGVWMTLTAVIVLLAGVCVWGVFGRLDTTLHVSAVVKDDTAICYVKEDKIDSIKVGQTVNIKGNEYTVESVSASPVSVSADTDSYALHIGSLTVGEWVYEVKLTTALPDGVYESEIVVESVKPLSFLFN